MATPAPPFKAFPSGYLTAQDPVPMVTHLHGAEVPSVYDGGPDVWFTRNGKYGPQFTTRHYVYPNGQEATSMFYHDHAPGMTRLNVFAGLAGFWVIRDPEDQIAPLLPDGKYWLPMAIQDRSFAVKDPAATTSSSSATRATSPTCTRTGCRSSSATSSWSTAIPGPIVDVDRGQYRLTILNGCNARFLRLSFDNGMSFVVIGSDGGYLQAPVRESRLCVLPGSRMEMLVDFSNVAAGTEIILVNDAPRPSRRAPCRTRTPSARSSSSGWAASQGFMPEEAAGAAEPDAAGSRLAGAAAGRPEAHPDAGRVDGPGGPATRSGCSLTGSRGTAWSRRRRRTAPPRTGISST